MTEEKKKTFRHHLWTAVRIALAAVVIWWMFHKGFIKVDVLRNAAANWELLVGAIILILIHVYLTAVRWGELLAVQNFNMKPLHLFRLNMAGFFFSLAAPGGVGCDGIKLIFVAKDSTRKPEAVASIFLDRYIGMITLFGVGALALAINFNNIWHSDIEGVQVAGFTGGQVITGAVWGFVILLAALGFAFSSTTIKNIQLSDKVKKYIPFKETLLRAYNFLHIYRGHGGALAKSCLISIAAQIPLFLVYYICAIAVGADVKLWQIALIVPPATVIKVMPIFIFGAVQGTIAFAALFPLIGVANGIEIGLLADVIFAVTYIIGAPFFVAGWNKSFE